MELSRKVLNNEKTQHIMKTTPVNYVSYYQSPQGKESELERGDEGTPGISPALGEQRGGAGGAGGSLS